MIATLPLKAKLAILSAIPLLCAIGLGTKLSFERVAELKEFRSFEKAMQLSVLLAEVNSINSSEQGSIWGFGESAVADNSESVVREVKNKWEKDVEALNVAMSKVQGFLQNMDLSVYGDSLREALDEVDAFYEKFPAHRADVRDGIDYGTGVGFYNEFKAKIQAVYPALLQETSDKDLSLKLSSYGIYLDYHYECTSYMGLMIWAHQTSDYPEDAYFNFEKHFARSQILLKHFKLISSSDIVAKLDEILASDRSVWVDNKVRSFLIENNNGTKYVFVEDEKLETELKSKGEGRNDELAAFQATLRRDVLDYTANRIGELEKNRNLTAGSTLLVFLVTIVFAAYIGGSVTKALTEITESIADEAERVFSAAKEIANSSETLAGNSCAQASSSEETNAMIETIRSNSKSAVGYALAAGKSIRETSSIILESNESMQDLNASIESISTNSRETKKIMSSINDIAFQTNILALNAAVEAARAGEAGAGFAIVADEVRNLAQRSSQASDNTSKLIESSNASINSGLSCAGKTSEAFGKVKDSAEQVIARIVEIEEEMNKQVEAITEISRAAEKMDMATQSNAASAEECAASSSSLESHARGLEDQVERLGAIVNGKSSRRFPKRDIQIQKPMKPQSDRAPVGAHVSGAWTHHGR